MSEHFSLQWDDFHKNMSSGMQSLLESEDLADVTLAVEGRQLKAHKMVLSLCSPYFRQLFQSSPCKHPIVFMRDVSYTSLIDLLQFMYQGEVQVAQENFPTFIKTAAALQIKGLAEDSTNQSGEITEATKRHPAEVLPPLPMQCETKAKRCRRLGSKRVRVSSPSPSSSPAAAVEPAENVIFLKTEPSDSVEASTDGEVADETRDSYVDETLLEEDNTLMETNEDSKPGTSSDGIGDSQRYSVQSEKISETDLTLTNHHPIPVEDPVVKLREEFHLFRSECLTRLEEVKQEVVDLKDLLRDVLPTLETNGRKETVGIYPTLPLQSEEELNYMESIVLIDQDRYNALVSELKRIGGSTTTKHCYNVLKHCIAHNLALKLRFTCKSGKVAFGQTRVAQAIRDAILANPQDSLANITFINMLIGKWLRNSTDRGRNRERDDSGGGVVDGGLDFNEII